MIKYSITFITNSEQATPFTKSIEAGGAKEARLELRNEAAIPARFIKAMRKKANK